MKIEMAIEKRWSLLHLQEEPALFSHSILTRIYW